MSNKEILASFCRNTSGHGFAKCINAKGICRVIWCFILLGAFVGFTYHFWTLAKIYLTYSKTTELDTLHNNFIFPDITFCPTTQFSNSKFERSSETLVKKFSDFWEKAQTVYPELNKISKSLLVLSSFRAKAYIDDIYRYPQDHIIDCMYMGEPCDFRNFTVYKHPTNFLCFTFRPTNRRLTAEGFKGGFNIILMDWRGLGYNVPNLMDDIIRGFEITINEVDARPSYSKHIIFAQTGSKVEVPLTLEVHDLCDTPRCPCYSEDRNYSLALDFGRNNFENRTFKLTNYDVVPINKQKHIIDHCGCLSAEHLVESDFARNYVFCNQINSSTLAYFLQESNNLTLYAFLDNSGIARKSLCNHYEEKHIPTILVKQSMCNRPCHNLRYNYWTQYRKWPSVIDMVESQIFEKIQENIKLAKELNVSLDPSITEYKPYQWKEAMYKDKYPFVSLNFFASCLDTALTKENLAMSLTELLANLGGMMGLWIGVSFVTLFEFMEVFGKLILNSLSLVCRKVEC